MGERFVVGSDEQELKERWDDWPTIGSGRNNEVYFDSWLAYSEDYTGGPDSELSSLTSNIESLAELFSSQHEPLKTRSADIFEGIASEELRVGYRDRETVAQMIAQLNAVQEATQGLVEAQSEAATKADLQKQTDEIVASLRDRNAELAQALSDAQDYICKFSMKTMLRWNSGLAAILIAALSLLSIMHGPLILSPWLVHGSLLASIVMFAVTWFAD